MSFALSKPTYNPEDRLRLFATYREAGFAGLQLKAAQYADFLDRPKEFLELIEDDRGIVSALITNDTLDPAGLERLDALVDFAAAVGAERIVYCNKRDRAEIQEADIAESARVLSRAGRRARDVGVAISLHHHFGQPVMYRPDFDVFFDAVQDDAVGLTIDTGHLARSGITDAPAVIRDFAAVIDNFHLKDGDGDRWRLIGEGTLDFGPVVEAIREIGYGGWLCADEESKAELDHAVATSATGLRSLFPGT